MGREQLRRNINNKQHYMVIDFNHINSFDEYLSTQLLRSPADVLRMVSCYMIDDNNVVGEFGSSCRPFNL